MSCPNKYQKSSLRAYNTSEQGTTSGSNLTFSTIGYQSGVSIKYTAGDSTIYLKSPGLYYISFDAIITNETANTETAITLNANGSAVAGALTEVTVTAIGDYIPGSIHAVIPVGPQCPCSAGVPITFTVTGTTPAVSNVNLNIIKIA